MKEIINDILGEKFTMREYLIYGIAAPLAFVIVCIIAGMIE